MLTEALLSNRMLFTCLTEAIHEKKTALQAVKENFCGFYFCRYQSEPPITELNDKRYPRNNKRKR